MDVPMLHFGGWYDFMLRGTLRAYREAGKRSSRPQRLIVGPWTHMPWGRRVGAADFGPEAFGFVDQLQIAWFDRFLKDVDNGVDQAPAVRLFDLVAKTWRDFDHWPELPRRAFYTRSDGLAASSESGLLDETPAAHSRADAIVHDPWRPAPSLGGHVVRPGRHAGAFRDRQPPGCRHLHDPPIPSASNARRRRRTYALGARRPALLRRQRGPV